jgi:hypothetical protein
MSFSLADVEFLASEAGTRLLARLASEDLSDANTLSLLTRLRRDANPEQAGAALALARLRLKAVNKFGTDAAMLFFTREALEQSSDPLVRRWRARNPTGETQPLVDACCGIGSDALAYAAAKWDVLGLDIDPVRIEMARLNAAALGLPARFDVADVREDARLLSPHLFKIFYDPARRTDDGRRLYDVERYEPPLSLIHTWLARREAVQIEVKLSPGVEVAQVESYGGTLTFISVSGDLKEALLSTNWQSIEHPHLVREAVLLTEAGDYHWTHTGDADAPISEPSGWLIEPDPALIRAGLVQDAAMRFGGALLDESIAYITAERAPATPWGRAWQILDWIPFNLKKLRTYLRERGVGQVTVKKRGTAVTPEMLIPQLKLKGDASRTIVLTRFRGAQIVLICADYEP